MDLPAPRVRMPGFSAEIAFQTMARRAGGGGNNSQPIEVCDCVSTCRRVKMCLLQYCYEETICDYCVSVRNCRLVYP